MCETESEELQIANELLKMNKSQQIFDKTEIADILFEGQLGTLNLGYDKCSRSKLLYSNTNWTIWEHKYGNCVYQFISTVIFLIIISLLFCSINLYIYDTNNFYYLLIIIFINNKYTYYF